MKRLNISLLACLSIALLSCNNSTKSKSNIKVIEQTIRSKEITVNAQGIIETKSEPKLIPTKLKKIIGFINICDTKIGYKDTFVLRNTIEYHLNNGIIYIKEFYPNKKLKSESYWVDHIIPTNQIKQYNQNGNISKIIDKSIGKYDLCYVLNKIKSLKELEGKAYLIHLSNKLYDDNDITWFITYNNTTNRFGSDNDEILIDTKTGRTTDNRISISDQPANLNEPTLDQLPTFPGGIKTYEKYVANSIDVPHDSLVNAEVIVMYSVDTYGKVGNFRTEGGTNYLNNEVLKIVKKMPDWTAAKDNNTDGACNVKGEDYGKYTFGFSVYFRRFE